MVLVRRDCDEGRFWEHMSAESGVFGPKSIIFICLHDVDPGLIFVHGIQDDLERKQSLNTTIKCVAYYLMDLLR